MNIDKIVEKHRLWIIGDKNGERANLSDADLSGAILRGANLSDAYLRGANLRCANLSGANLSVTNLRGANLSGADLIGADLIGANLRGANLRGTNLSDAYLGGAILIDANLRGANLSGTNLSDADLIGANLRGANLRGANLRGANLRGANLSDAKGLLSAIDYLADNFEQTDDGYIVYKCFNGTYPASSTWNLESGSVVEEEVNPNRTDIDGCGINVVTLSWVRNEYPNKKVYKLLIRWPWLAGVVVPYNTDGKIRCARAEIIGEV